MVEIENNILKIVVGGRSVNTRYKSGTFTISQGQVRDFSIQFTVATLFKYILKHYKTSVFVSLIPSHFITVVCLSAS